MRAIIPSGVCASFYSGPPGYSANYTIEVKYIADPVVSEIQRLRKIKNVVEELNPQNHPLAMRTYPPVLRIRAINLNFDVRFSVTCNSRKKSRSRARIKIVQKYTDDRHTT